MQTPRSARVSDFAIALRPQTCFLHKTIHQDDFASRLKARGRVPRGSHVVQPRGTRCRSRSAMPADFSAMRLVRPSSALSQRGSQLICVTLVGFLARLTFDLDNNLRSGIFQEAASTSLVFFCVASAMKAFKLKILAKLSDGAMLLYVFASRDDLEQHAAKWRGEFLRSSVCCGGPGVVTLNASGCDLGAMLW
jgi:hypothetical protein